MRLHGKDYSAGSLARMEGDLAAAGGVRSVVLGDGTERGVRALEFRTGSGLNFDVLVDRAMDIGSAEYRGVGFGWQSATGFRHPADAFHHHERFYPRNGGKILRDHETPVLGVEPWITFASANPSVADSGHPTW